MRRFASLKCRRCMAADVAAKLQAIFADRPRPSQAPREPVHVGFDERTNNLFVAGPPERVARARAYVEALEAAIQQMGEQTP